MQLQNIIIIIHLYKAMWVCGGVAVVVGVVTKSNFFCINNIYIIL